MDLWTVANSPVGLTLIVPAVVGAASWVWRKVTRKRPRLQQLAHEAYQIAETLGAMDKLRGSEKYGVFVDTIERAAKAEGLGRLTKADLAMLAETARREALLNKPAAPPSSGR